MHARLPLAVATSLLTIAFVGCGSSKTRQSPAVPDSAITSPDASTLLDAGVDAGPAEPDAGTTVDAGNPQDAGLDAGAEMDAGLDAGLVDAGLDAGVDAGPMCPPPPMFNYQCDPHDPSTCPMGFCIVNLCLAPQVNPHQWDSCGNSVCDPCETAQTCPADCGTPPVLTGTKTYDDNTTITVWLHGWVNAGSSLATTVYGEASGCGDIGKAYQAFGVNRPCGNTPQTEVLPNNEVAMEYLGAVPPSWMSPQDVAEIEQYPAQGGTDGLHRYALITAKFIRHRMAISGATHVNLACHSMGCLISRYMIENDLEQLASQNVIVRWVTAAGVIAGARLARLYDNPTVQQVAQDIGLQLSDFVIMNPDFVQANVAVWDHKLYEGNNPLFSGILIHDVGATNPHIDQAAGIQLLDLYNPGDEPNDGIMFTLDEFFHSQSPAASVQTPSGEVVSATHTYIYQEHQVVAGSVGFQAIAAAGMTGRRKVFLSLQSIKLKVDREFDLSAEPTEQGLAPAEVVIESHVSYDPYTVSAFGLKTPVQDDIIDYRSPDLFQQTEGTTLTPNQVFFAGPVFDQQNALHLKVQLTEADAFKRWNVNEALLDPNRSLANWEGDITLQEQTIPISSQYVDAVLQVHVVNLY